MTVENISWSISTKECCRPRQGLNPRPPGLQSDDASNWTTEAGHPICNYDYPHFLLEKNWLIWSFVNIVQRERKKSYRTSEVLEVPQRGISNQYQKCKCSLEEEKKKKKKKKKMPMLCHVCLFVLRFYGPVNPMGSCRARSVYLTTRLLGRQSSKRLTSIVHILSPEIFVMFAADKNICCRYSLEVPHQGTSNEYSQHFFCGEIKKIILIPLFYLTL